MNGFVRGAALVLFAASSILMVNCSGGVSVPAAGSTKPPATPSPTPSGATPTPSPTVSGATPTPSPTPSGATPTPSPTVSGATPTPSPTASSATPTPSPTVSGATPTPTPTPTTKATATPTPTPTPTSVANGCPPAFPSPQPISSTQPFPPGGGTLTLPPFADQTGTVMIPSNNVTAGTTIAIQESQTPFTDQGGNGAIPTPPSGYTAISYTASFISPAQTINFTSGDINITASAPCEITSGHTYVAYVYANGGGLPHTEIGPTGLGDTAPFPTTQSTVNGKLTIAFTINLANNIPADEQPMSTGLEVVVAQQN